MKDNNKYEMDFSKIKTVENLIRYLDDTNARLNNRKYLYHYTTIKCIINIFYSGKWFLSNAKEMNDQLEYKNGDKNIWKNIFFTSFMTDVKENIGMWSMYAQPWEDGVLIQLPKEVVKKWIKGISKVYEVSYETNKVTNKIIPIDRMNKVYLSSVAYSNCDSTEFEEVLKWSTVSNRNIKKATHIPELTGYVKDMAWDYEREIRIKAYLDNEHCLHKVAVDIPEFVYDAMTLIAGPLFQGDLKRRLSEEISSRVNLSHSLFSGKLKI